jgi:hypothetical protein
MPSHLDQARDFYAALARADADRLRCLLHPSSPANEHGPGHGLTGMRERAALLAARCRPDPRLTAAS